MWDVGSEGSPVTVDSFPYDLLALPVGREEVVIHTYTIKQGRSRENVEQGDIFTGSSVPNDYSAFTGSPASEDVLNERSLIVARGVLEFEVRDSACLR